MQNIDDKLSILIDKINNNIIAPIVWLLVAGGIIVFIYGLMIFIFNPESDKKAEGKQHMLWGIIGLVIIFSSWGIMNLISNTVQSF